ncbi:Dynamin central region-domain-containing protein [Mycena capillaripes]|nr:Dynamin central region-domain-containing protein [Mycena capillaripes]
MSSSYLSDSEYANRRKELLALMSQLRSVGAQGDLDLPRIAINVPRDSGTCTRCPLECRLVSAPEWACRISIRREFDVAGGRLIDVSEIPFGDLIRDRTEVEMMLRRAQLAVLDPAAEIARIMRMNLKELKEKLQDGTTAQFSRNVVCIDLEGPELTDVQFVDLPDDIENQKAMTLAREQDPDGVLTKPDLLSAGSTTARTLWHDVILGRRHKLRHGYFCTRQPDDDERANGITAAEARRIETEFFARSDRWAMCPEQRLGTDNLISTLSSRLVEMISDTLPRIICTANTHLEECRTALAAVPEPLTDDPATYLLTLITDFCTEIKQCVHGSSERNNLIQKNNTAFQNFKKAIGQTAPAFVASFPQAMEEDSEDSDHLSVSTDGEQENSQEPIYLTDVRETLRRTRARELPGDVPPAAKAALIADFQETWGRSTEICFDHVRDSLSDVLSRTMEHFFSRFIRLERALWIYVRSLILAQSEDCAKYLEAVLQMEMTAMTQNDDFLQAEMEKWVVKYKEQQMHWTPTTIPTPARQIIRAPESPNTSSAVPRQRPVRPLPRRDGPADEPAVPAAQGTSAPSGFGQPPAGSTPATSNPFNTPAPMTALPGFRRTAPLFAPQDSSTDPVDEILSLLARLGYNGLKPEDLGRLHAGDEYETEILLMSGVRAYFEVSYRRIIDIIPGLIDVKFVKTFASGLQANLIREFKLGQPDAHAQCAEYLTEDPAVATRRADLTQRLNMLESVQRDLLDFGHNEAREEGSAEV